MTTTILPAFVGHRLPKLLLSLFLPVLVLSPMRGQAEAVAASPGPRLALIVANFEYQSRKDRLTGPLRDAATLQKALKEGGFIGIDGDREPTVLANGTKIQITQKLHAFRAALKGAGPLALGVLYFAGHGGSNAAGTENYLLPVDTPDVGGVPIETYGIGVREITELLKNIDVERRPAIAIVIDACRTLQSGRGTDSPDTSRVRPMVKPDDRLPKGMLVALSTGAGQIAPDSGVYADVLASRIKASSGVPLAVLFDEVMREVAQKTGQAQIPVQVSQIVVKVCIGVCVDGGSTADLRAALECNALRPEDLNLAVRARNIERAATVIRCRREFLTADEVRTALAAQFRSSDFAQAEAFLGQMRKAGVRFLADFRPANPDRTEEYGSSPLRTAVAEWNTAAVAWLVAGGEANALSSYPALLAMQFRRLTIGDTQTQLRAHDTVRALVRAGLPTSFNDFDAFRQVYRGWLQTQFGTVQRRLGAGARSGDWENLFGDARPKDQADYWYRLAQLLAPSRVEDRREATRRAAREFAKPRIDGLTRIEGELQKMLRGPGLRTVEDPKHPLGARNIEAAPGTLRDDDLVFDSYGLQSADGWASVGGIRATLRGIDEAKILLSKLQQAELDPSPEPTR